MTFLGLKGKKMDPAFPGFTCTPWADVSTWVALNSPPKGTGGTNRKQLSRFSGLALETSFEHLLRPMYNHKKRRTQTATSSRNFCQGKTQQLTVFFKFQGGKILLGAKDGKITLLSPIFQLLNCKSTGFLVTLPSCNCHLRSAAQQFIVVLHCCLGCNKKIVHDKLKVTNKWQFNRRKSVPHEIISPRG